MESSDSDYDDILDLYLEKHWESGHNFKVRTSAFAKADDGLAFLLKKSNYEKAIDDFKFRTLEVQKKDGKLSHIEITDEEGAGEVKLQIWGPNKRNKMVTVQVSKSSNDEVKHVDILTNKVIKPLLDKLLRGATIKELDKSFFTESQKPQIREENKGYDCPLCPRQFKLERAMKTHITRSHKPDVKSSSENENSESDSGKPLLSCVKCKKCKKPHNQSFTSASPARKKLKLSTDVSKAIIEEILATIMETEETETETDKELAKMEHTSYEEKRMDTQIMDHKAEEQRLSEQNDKKILAKRKQHEEAERVRQKESKYIKESLKPQEGTKRKHDSSTKKKIKTNAKIQKYSL